MHKQEFSRALTYHCPSREAFADICGEVLPDDTNDRVQALLDALGIVHMDVRADLMQLAGIFKSSLNHNEMMSVTARILELYPDEVHGRRREKPSSATPP